MPPPPSAGVNLPLVDVPDVVAGFHFLRGVEGTRFQESREVEQATTGAGAGAREEEEGEGYGEGDGRRPRQTTRSFLRRNGRTKLPFPAARWIPGYGKRP